MNQIPIEQIVRPITPTKKITSAMSQELKVMLSNESGEWYTPALYTHLAKEVMGGIDLDPASNSAANEWIGADRIFTKQDNGLRFPWWGRVWLNPPYCKTEGRSNQDIWSQKLITEYRAGRVGEAILLVKAAQGYIWYDDLLREWPCCLMYGLIGFINAQGGQPGKAKLGSTFFYFGPNFDRFSEVFNRIGKVIP